MAKIAMPATVAVYITLELSESEAAALDAIACYGDDAFLKAFYENLGRTYLQPHEKGLRSLFNSVRSGDASVSGFLKQAKDARAVLTGAKRAVNSA